MSAARLTPERQRIAVEVALRARANGVIMTGTPRELSDFLRWCAREIQRTAVKEVADAE